MQSVHYPQVWRGVGFFQRHVPFLAKNWFFAPIHCVSLQNVRRSGGLPLSAAGGPLPKRRKVVYVCVFAKKKRMLKKPKPGAERKKRAVRLVYMKYRVNTSKSEKQTALYSSWVVGVTRLVKNN